MICVIATITLKNGQRDNYLREMRKILKIVHAEDGCHEYRPTVDIPTGNPIQKEGLPDTVVILEKWETLDALKKHGASAHMTDFRHRVKAFVQSMELQILSPVE